MPVDYQGGKIYTIRAPETDKYYIGSTTQTLPKRFHSHKRDYACYQNGKMNNITSFQILELEGAYIELLELYPTNNKAELERREGQLIREHRDNCVNRIVVGRTKKEYREDNKEAIKVREREYREANKETLTVKNREYREANKETINAKKREHHHANKEAINAKSREYREANKEAIKAKASEKIQCECGASVSRGYISGHRKSKRHLKFIEDQNE